jgi:hypothetical protein
MLIRACNRIISLVAELLIIGHFEYARGIPVDSFRDTFPYVDELLAKHKQSNGGSNTQDSESKRDGKVATSDTLAPEQPKLMIYCTG